MSDPLKLGRSLAFPPRPDGKGGLAIVEGAEAVENNIEAIISSKKGSHAFQPSLGVDPSAFRADTSPDVVGKCVRDAIIYAEDRINADTLSIQVNRPNADRRPIRVNYTIRGEITARSFETSIKLDA